MVAGLLALSGCSSEPVDFVAEIEPIFRAHCYGCHGEAQQFGLLRLDAKGVVFQEGPGGSRVVPEQPEASALYRRVAGIGVEARMPPGGPLAPDQVRSIRRWIEQGAAWPDGRGTSDGLVQHWAYSAPRRPAVPEPARREWSANPIDEFILARLEAGGLEPAPPAAPETLLRRLSLDLTGLPPRAEDVKRFRADSSPGAYAREVERLLASPHYGERWGREWLDGARYADSDGYEKDLPRSVWFYRDWVVDALNRDLPYDRFVIEQVAGDLLEGAGQNERVATGFLRNSLANTEGGADPEQFRMEALFGRMEVIGKAVLGMTVECAQCHDHHYDPLSQRDYYRMLAFLNSCHETTLAVYTPAQQRTRRRILGAIRSIEAGLRRDTPDWLSRMARWAAAAAKGQPDWRVLDASIEPGSGVHYEILKDGSILAQGFAPTRSTVSPEAPLPSGTVNAVRLELLTEPRLPLGGPGRSVLGTAALTEFKIEVARQSQPGTWKELPIASATADVNPDPSPSDPVLFPSKDDTRRLLGGIEFAVDGSERTAWSTDLGPGRRNVPRKAVFQLAEPLVADEPLLLRFHLVMTHGGWNTDDNQTLHLGRYRFSVTSAAGSVADPLPASVRRIVSGAPAGKFGARQEAEVFSYWRTTVPEWSDANGRIEALWKRHPEGASQLVVSERSEPRLTHVLLRGDFLRPGDAVEPGVPDFLHSLPEGSASSRLEFARWLIARDAPTTARAIVNRVWQGHFGTGLVETPADFGRRSAYPSHPRLLDWLAVEFMDSGWSLKQLHRLIVTSSAYRQSAKASTALLELDPRNRLLARGARYRVDGETVRDIALAGSGLLETAVGGRPVYPSAPAFLFVPPASYGPKRWPSASGGQLYRRSLYAFRYRSVPHPVLEAFDVPAGSVACVRRERSNTPLQALVTLNEEQFFEAARELGRRIVQEGGSSDSERIDHAFWRVLARAPARAESRELLEFVARQRRRMAAGEIDPALLAPAPDERGSLSVPAAGAEWTALARVVLNLDETFTRE